MNYRGRIVTISLVWSVFLLAMLFSGLGNSGDYAIILPGLFIIYTLISWIIGQKYDRMAYDAVRDMLTLTYNRRYVHNIFAKMKKQARRRGQNLILYIIDVDDFKEVNDQYGHAVGDAVLKSISDILKGMLGDEDIIARWGGDEFIMIVFHDGQNGRLLDAFSIETGIGELHHRVNGLISVSIGQASYPDDASTLEELLKVADDNMYGLKQECKEDKHHDLPQQLSFPTYKPDKYDML